ncbi:ribosome biogenesis GTPase YlqF [Geomonas azotofigens]|uniref:ribosome biogenesis GTPase YlqF n=1 Tax=Geomonas azotofigens TaxID=2843196 RepID=UPI001C1101DB|nr:ribosome biogenesis GTPase YlqF [Geomonas azotofigens]MBU5612934.1 ribosome biogenesis GTPase YlqF [Geomonas azotofigens]
MTIRWYPGHMSKALEQISELVRKIDLIIEVLDARLPFSSSNHLLEQVRRNKPCIKVLNKNDLADPAVTRAWVQHFQKSAGVRALPLVAKNIPEVKSLVKLCKQMVPQRGNPGYPIRTMVVGIPNVGKSTLINTLAGRSIAKVGDRPAVTMRPQQIPLNNGILIFDTPGLLWPAMDDQGGAYRLATSGAIGANALDYTNVGVFAAAYMMRRYPDLLKERYKLTELPETPHEVIEAVGRCLGCIMSGGVVDVHRAAETFLRELRAGKAGHISFEEPGTPEDVEAELLRFAGIEFGERDQQAPIVPE